MPTNSDCGENGQPLTRPRFFPRQVVTAADLNADQEYFRALMRRHNHYLHGCGVICGLEVLLGRDASGSQVAWITPGHAIDPLGNDIHVPEQIPVPTGTPAGTGACAAGGAQRIYLALSYHEVLTDPVPTLPGPCTPVGSQEPSRAVPGYKLDCLTELQLGCWAMPPCGMLTWEIVRTTPAADPYQSPPACPPGDCQPWVLLAALDINAYGDVVYVDYGVRRRVLSVQMLVDVLRCLLPRIDSIVPPAGIRDSELLAMILGAGLAGASAVHFSGRGIAAQVLPEFGRDNLVVARLRIAPDAPLGPRTFELTTPRGTFDSAARGITFTVLPRTTYPYPYPYPYPGYPGVPGGFSTGIGGNLL